MKRKQHTALTLALGSALAASFASTSSTAGENPFASQSIGTGYMVAATEGKCGQGKCGAAMGMSEKDKASMSKTDDGKCGAGEGKKAAQDKAAAEKTKAKSKSAEGKCAGAKN
jgi:uncharacterized low-complexity protein